jgi:enoyl-CoA hydratase/carnithine racemase
MEILVNCDLVVASEDAKFAFPEVRRGVTASQGGELILPFKPFNRTGSPYSDHTSSCYYSNF